MSQTCRDSSETTRHRHGIWGAKMAWCGRHGLCRVGDMAPTCRCVCRFGGKKSLTRRRHYQPRWVKRLSDFDFWTSAKLPEQFFVFRCINKFQKKVSFQGDLESLQRCFFPGGFRIVLGTRTYDIDSTITAFAFYIVGIYETIYYKSKKVQKPPSRPSK